VRALKEPLRWTGGRGKGGCLAMAGNAVGEHRDLGSDTGVLLTLAIKKFS
jgi:hypothetical protein